MRFLVLGHGSEISFSGFRVLGFCGGLQSSIFSELGVEPLRTRMAELIQGFSVLVVSCLG